MNVSICKVVKDDKFPDRDIKVPKTFILFLCLEIQGLRGKET